MNRKPQSTKKTTAKGKAEGSKGQGAERRRARRLIESNRYGDKVTAKLRRALDGSPGTLRDILAQLDEIETKTEAHRKGAHEYASKAYSAALEHYGANVNDPFALSRLALVFDEQKPGDVNMVVTLPGALRDREAFNDESVRGWISDAELLARALDHPDCSEAFRKAFGAIFTETMLDGSGISWTTGEVMRVMFPLVMLESTGNSQSGDTFAARDILILLVSELNSDELDRDIRKPLGMQ